MVIFAIFLVSVLKMTNLIKAVLFKIFKGDIELDSMHGGVTLFSVCFKWGQQIVKWIVTETPKFVNNCRRTRQQQNYCSGEIRL